MVPPILSSPHSSQVLSPQSPVTPSLLPEAVVHSSSPSGFPGGLSSASVTLLVLPFPLQLFLLSLLCQILFFPISAPHLSPLNSSSAYVLSRLLPLTLYVSVSQVSLWPELSLQLQTHSCKHLKLDTFKAKASVSAPKHLAFSVSDTIIHLAAKAKNLGAHPSVIPQI